MIASKFGLRDLAGSVSSIADGIPSTFWSFDNPPGLPGNSWMQFDFGYEVNLVLFRLQKLAQGIGDFVIVCSDAPATSGSDAVQSGDFVTPVFRDLPTGTPPDAPDLKFWTIPITGTGTASGAPNTSYFTMPLLPKAFRYYRLMPAGTLAISAGVQLSEFQPDASITVTQSGFTSSDPTSNMVDGDLGSLWTPTHSTFASADLFPGDGSAPLPGFNYPFIQLDFALPVVLGMLLVKQLPGALPPCRLIASNLPATLVSNSVQAGDVQIASFSQAEIDSGQFKQTNLNTGDGQSFRYYRLVFQKNAGPSGAAVREMQVFFPLNKTYIENDYDSIWGRGERVKNGIVSTGWYGYNSIVNNTDNVFDGTTTNNLTFGGGNTPAGASMWFDFGPWGLELHGFALVCSGLGSTQTTPTSVALVGGLAPGAYLGISYTATFSEVQWSQSNLPALNETLFEPSKPFGWPHYEFLVAHAQNPIAAGSFIFGDVWLKVAHSNLDGGDRRNIGGTRPDKFVQISLSSGVVARTVSGDLPLTALVDGGFNHAGTPPGSRNTGTRLVEPVHSGAVTNPGEWIQFEFPRNVRMNHIILNTFSAQESYSAGLPQHWGAWHWEYSDDGAAFTSMGGSWSFSPGVDFMLAPRQTASSPETSSVFINNTAYATSTMVASGNPAQSVTVVSTPSAHGGQGSPTEKRNGKLYLEAVCHIGAAGGFGFYDGAKNVNAGSSPADAITLNTDGKVYVKDSTAVVTGFGGGSLTGTHRYGWALDLDAALGWVRIDGGNWNNDPTANPVTGVGGIDLRNTSFGWAVLQIWFWADTTGDTCTFNSLGPFTDTKPAGFSAWDQAFASASQSGFNPPAFGHAYWRMVLDSGSFGGAQTMVQFIFNLTDEGNQETAYRVSFSDDASDGLTLPLPSNFISPAGNPYQVAFSDGANDGLTEVISITTAHILRFDIDDGADIEFVSRDLMPSQVVQTVVNIRGR